MMKNLRKRALSIFLAFVLCASLVPTAAFAAEGDEGGDVVVDVTISDNSSDNAGSADTSKPEHDSSYSDTKTETDEETGKTTTTTTSGWSDIDDSDPDKKTESSEEKVETTVTDKDGNVVEESGSVKGESTTTTTENTETTEPGTPDDEQEPTVDVKPGETETVKTPGKFEETGTTSETKTETKVDGDLPYAGDVTVTLNPGDTDKKVTASLTDEALGNLLFMYDEDYPLNEIMPGPKVETNEDGDTVTTSTSQEDGKIVKTVVTERKDGSKVEVKTTVDLKGTPNEKDGTNVTEFTITTVTTTTNAPETKEDVKEGDVTTTSKTDTSYESPEDTVTITLPAKPEASEKTAEDGTKTVVTVEEIKNDNGETVGYQTTTTVTSADGKKVSSNSESVWGTKTTISTIKQKDTTTTTNTSTNTVTTTTTTLITQGTTVSGHKITATEREVIASMGHVKAGTNNGKVTMTPTVTPNIREPSVGTTNEQTDLYRRADAEIIPTDSGKKTEDGKPIYNVTIKPSKGNPATIQMVKDGDTFKAYDKDFVWLGEYGLESAIMVSGVKKGDVVSNGWQPHQFVLTDKQGNKFTVYCADFEVSPKGGAHYDMANIENAPYYSKDNAEHIRYIAENGYWGTASDAGSLDAVKNLMREANKVKAGTFTEEQINNLTPGQALTATQAAIWHFGNSGVNSNGTLKEGALFIGQDSKGNYAEITNAYNYGGSTGVKYDEVTVNGEHKDDYAVVKQLYQYLIQGKQEAPDETVFITEENFATNATITVGEKVAEKNEDGTDKKDGDGNTVFKMTTDNKAVYNTDVSFGMSVTPSQTGDLIVNVIVGGKVIATKRLAGDDTSTKYGVIPQVEGKYTISGLELPNGSTITLKLSGTQDLAQGVYLYTCSTGHDKSQTFVGMGQGKRDVDLSVNIDFTVKEPEATITKTDSGKTQQKTDTVTKTREDEITQKQVSAEITVFTTKTTENKTAWDNSWKNDYTPEPETPDTPETPTTPDRPSRPDRPTTPIPEEDVPLTPAPEEPTVNIPEEDVPLAPAPETPDTPDVTLPEPEVPLAPMPPEVSIPDEDVPLAGVPSTGEEVGNWLQLSLVCMAGLVILAIGKRREEV